jgi:hypothetical protein
VVVFAAHVPCDRLGKAVGFAHDVVLWHVFEGLCGPFFEGVGVVLGPGGGFEVEVAAEVGF